MAPAAPIRNVNRRRLAAVAAPNHTMAANRAEMAAVRISARIRNLRRSTMSASAPAGNANRKSGRVVATCTSATISGLGSRSVISQPEAALYIQLPTLETTVATHRMAKVACRKGLQAEDEGGEVSAADSFGAIMWRSGVGVALG